MVLIFIQSGSNLFKPKIYNCHFKSGKRMNALTFMAISKPRENVNNRCKNISYKESIGKKDKMVKAHKREINKSD